jgi:diguanylate cyclase (GGDEF)-like protein/PAS domain S-box-containing protein
MRTLMLRSGKGQIGNRDVVLLTVVALYAAVFGARQLSHDPTAGISFLYLLPIVLVAIEFGLGATVLAVAVALGLVAGWDTVGGIDLRPLGYAVRALVYLTVGALAAQAADRLHRAADETARTFEMASDMMLVGRFDGTVERINGRWSEVLGWPAEEIAAQLPAGLVHPDDLERTMAGIEDLVVNGADDGAFTNRMQASDGSWRTIEWSARVDREEQLLYATARDVTEREAAARAQRSAEERFRAAFEDSAMGMAVVSLEDGHHGQIVEANESLGQVLGRPREQLLGTMGMAAYCRPDELPKLREDFRRLEEGEMPVLRTELHVVRPDGQERWVHMTSSLLRDEDGRPVMRLSQMMDVDDRKRGEEKLRFLADYDPMSGLSNRRRFVADLERELDAHALKGSRGAVLVIDLDHFKEVNDSAGHAVGDEVIATVGHALGRRLRSGDSAGRLGGDEFGVVLRRVDAEDAILVAHSILRTVAYDLDQLDSEAARAVTLSIGVALIDDSSSRVADDLLARADAAMYDAKSAGGGRVALDPALPAAR